MIDQNLSEVQVRHSGERAEPSDFWCSGPVLEVIPILQVLRSRAGLSRFGHLIVVNSTSAGQLIVKSTGAEVPCWLEISLLSFS